MSGYRDNCCDHCSRPCSECPCCGNDQYCTCCHGCNICTPGQLKEHREEAVRRWQAEKWERRKDVR